MISPYPKFMKNIFKIIQSYLFIFSLFLTLSFSQNAFSMDSRLRVVSSMAGYGVVGGALLGTASLAFGANGRSIAKGASLGLYAGLLFGGYIVLSYEMKKRGYGIEGKGDYYPDSSSSFENRFSHLELSDDLRIFKNGAAPDTALLSMQFALLEF